TSRLRIQMRYNAFNGSSCGTYAEGEVEDYTVVFSGGTKDAGAAVVLKDQTAPFIPFGASLFPNPVSEEFTVVIPELDRTGEYHLWHIFDANGRAVTSGNTSAATFAAGMTVSARELPSGVYTFHLNTPSQKITKRFIVNRR
ncbi:MAG: T9SS type A sorting domain-containing protein, partial [Bacteroidota bacterium]